MTGIIKSIDFEWSDLSYRSYHGISITLDKGFSFVIWLEADKHEYPLVVSSKNIKENCQLLEIPFFNNGFPEDPSVRLKHVKDFCIISLAGRVNWLYEDVQKFEDSVLIAHFGIDNELAEWMLANPAPWGVSGILTNCSKIG